MRFAVVGAGAMGSLYAGMIARAGGDVWLVGRSPAHVAAIRARGLRITLPERGIDWTVPVRSTTDPGEPGAVDVVVFLTKIYDLAAAAAAARPLFGADTLALALPNGLGAAEAVAAGLGAVAIACGVSEVGGEILAPGHMTITQNVAEGRGFTRFGACARPIARARLDAVASALEASRLRAEVLDDVPGFLWTKLAMAGTMSSISALTRLRIGPIAGSAEGWRLIERMIGEVTAVAAARGIAVDRAAVLARARQVFSAVPAHVPSMAADLRQGRRTENEALAAAVSREGARLGVPTPMCDVVSDMIALVERHPGESIW